MVGPVLKTLDAIDWKSLNHAYGEASDVPKLLRALASDHAGKREGALDALFSTIWHQGTVYSASAAAVPFLIELAMSDAQGDLPAILDLLAHLATGSSYLDAHQHLSHFEEERAAPEFADRLAGELVHVRAAKEAVVRGASVYARRLRHEDPAVRVAAAYLLGLCPSDASRAALKKCTADDAEPAVRAVAAFALGCIADDALAPEVREMLEDESEHPAVRLYAGFGLARGAATLTDEALDALAELVDDAELFAQLDELHDNAARMSYGPLADCLLGLPPSSRARLVPALGRALEAIRGRDALGLATALLGLAFADSKLPEGAGPEALNEVQRAALESLVRAPSAWRYANIETALHDVGLPDDGRPELAAWLGLELPEDAEDDEDEDEADADEDEDEVGEDGEGDGEGAGLDIDAPEPDDAALARIARFSSALDGEQWREAKQWFSFYQQMRGAARVEPPAIARYFGERANLEAGYWLYDRELSKRVGVCVPLEHIRLAIGEKSSQEHVALRIRVDEGALEPVLAAIVRHQDRATPTDFTALALELIAASPEVLLETGPHQRARLGRAGGNA
jgi:HEAT repeat protein